MDTGGLPEDTKVPVSVNDPLLGRHVAGKFLLERQLGAGAMGAVYRARQTALEKVVAIKVMHGDLARDAMFAARFHREAKAASRLDHPNSIRILDYGQDHDGLLYIAMEYLDGRDLAHLIVDDWPLSRARVVDLMSQALGAIAVAHEMGITHRDLKPENIMVLARKTDDGAMIDVVKVCDFGIAKIGDTGEENKSETQAKGKLTTAGLVIGTPAYMSPEQGRGDAIDGRSDLYSMGVILYQLLAGQLPFDAPTALGLVLKHQTVVPEPPSKVREGVDPHLEVVTLKALKKDPSERYQTARELRTAIRAGEGGASVRGESFGPRSVSAGLSDPEVAMARTELQMAAVPTSPNAAPTSPIAVAVTQPALENEASTSPSKFRTPLIAVAIVVAGLATAWRLQGSSTNRTAAVAESPPSTIASASTPVTAAPAPLPSATSSTAPSPAEPAEARRDLAGHTPAVVAASSQHASSLANPARLSAHAEPALAQPAAEPPAIAAAPPAPVAPVVPVPASPPAVPPQAAPAFDLTTASVTVQAPSKHDGIGATAVSGPFGHLKSRIVDCYRANLATLSVPLEGTGSLHLDIDENGAVTRASVSGPVRGPVGTCIVGLAMTLRFSPDTGGASADIPLEFKAR